MILRQAIIETRKTIAHPALWLGLGGLTVLLAGFLLVEHAQIYQGFARNPGGLESDLVDVLIFASWIGSLVYGCSAAVITAGDYPDRSIQVWLERGLSRPALLLARLVVVLFFGLLLATYTVFASLGIAALSRLLFFGRVDATLFNWFALAPAVFRVFWSSVPYLALTALLGILTRSPIYSAAGTVVYATVLENLAGSLADRFPALVRYLPAQLSRVLLQHLDSLNLAAGPVEAAMPELRAVCLSGLLALVLVGAALVIFTRQDLGG